MAVISGVGSGQAMWSYGVVRDDRTTVREPTEDVEQPEDGSRAQTDASSSDSPTPPPTGGKQLTPDEEQIVSELQTRDRAVRAHESAHKAVGGSLAGGMSLSYQTGPDGRQYAIGGEVSIDTGGERDPQATIAKMRQVIAAALAPGDPSSQDQAVASRAQSAMADAQRQLSEMQRARFSAGKDQPTNETTANQASSSADGYLAQAEAPGSQLDLVA